MSKKYYGYITHRESGVVDNWNDCSEKVKGVKGAKFKSFASYSDAYQFSKNPSYVPQNQSQSQQPKKFNPKTPLKNASLLEMLSEDGNDDFNVPPGYECVWTDGACSDNQSRGKAVAGVGVYFGDNDPRNVSEPLEGEKQTNQRAELTAIIRALEKEPKKSLYIYSDSVYSIKGATEWMKNWKRKGWCKSDGGEVINKDLWEKLDGLLKNRKVLFEWVKGHSTNVGNIQADKLAVKGAELNAEKRNITAKPPTKMIKPNTYYSNNKSNNSNNSNNPNNSNNVNTNSNSNNNSRNDVTVETEEDCMFGDD